MNKYTCIKCGNNFEIEHEVEDDGALCNKCFGIFKKLNYEETIQFMMTAKFCPRNFGYCSETLIKTAKELE